MNVTIFKAGETPIEAYFHSPGEQGELGWWSLAAHHGRVWASMRGHDGPLDLAICDFRLGLRHLAGRGVSY